ncbi:MAG: hypothetical protein NPMRTH1_1010001 [Nitrosopumilales archaeon]|nr:MAG: hypothetical protein NPMRTH1_1010001 [Nitrosopumilales archaeon]
MSSSDQGSKTKQDKLNEYEKGYLVRVEEKEEAEEKPTEAPKVEINIPSDLQGLIFKIAGEFETNANKDYIGHCVVCVKKVERNKMVYKNDRLFHSNCFKQHGNEYGATTDLMRDERRAKMDLVYLKNLKLRMSNQGTGKNPGSAPKKRSVKKKSSKRKPAKRRTKRKASVKKRKPRPARRKVAKKRSRSKSRKRRR